ncbi:MAG TPA: DUF6089 family protein, partial [Flavitalea sp.]|nr:DUF6089 family protein [Flavitalea sp.]
VGGGLRYEITRDFAIRGELRYGRLEANDKLNGPRYEPRNLSFETKLYEASGLIEYSFNDLFENSFTPYLFAGLAIFHFNPFTYDTLGAQHWLRPLNTEGQGLSQYPDRKQYKLNQFAIPFGIGVRIEANEYVNLGFEVGARKLFTDYIDDVSTTYVDEQLLLNAYGPISSGLAYRGDELKNAAPYPIAGTVRGGPHKDWYYFAGVTIGFRLFDLTRSSFERKTSNKYKTDCPAQM